jgi:hypothetical protein
VELPAGLEELGEMAFFCCTSLQSINIPPSIKAIQQGTLFFCAALRDMDLSEGLESIGCHAFVKCRSLRHITIPSTVKKITRDIFNYDSGDHSEYSTNLERVQFCDDIKEFVSGESIQDWWDNGTLERSFQTYNFLILYKVPTRLILLSKMSWQENIHDMLRIIPVVDFDAFLDDHFTAIDAELTFYKITDDMSLLELALWKSKIRAQHGPNIGKLSGTERSQCRENCGACVINIS